jgi:WD40 repeat protein
LPVLLVWGGRWLALVRLFIDQNHIENTPRSISTNVEDVSEVPDWILYVCFGTKAISSSSQASSTGTPPAIFITAHNVLYTVSLTENTHLSMTRKPSFSVDRLVLGPRCILYSAHVKWISPSKILIASGTVFGEIVIWSCMLDYSFSSFQTATILTGHEGSIFGVQISDIVEGKTEHPLRLLTSCSDDRTIRVWDITDLSNISEAKIPSDGVAAEYLGHETGFLSYQTDKAETSSASRCCAVAMGHISRIWSVGYVYHPKSDHDSEDVVTILSTGEDATCQTWRLVQDVKSLRSLGSGKTTFDLIHTNTFSHHTGKNIWSVAVNQGLLNTKRPFIVTGGADGRVVSCTFPSLKQLEPSLSEYREEWDIDEVLRPTLKCIGNSLNTDLTPSPQRSKKLSKAISDCFRGYAFVGNDSLLLTTNNGLVLLAKLKSVEFKNTSSWSWHYIALLHELRGYSVACSIPEFGIAFVGSAKGTIHCFDACRNEINLLTTVEGKVADIFVQPLESSIGFMSLLITQMGKNALKHIYLRRDETGSLRVSKEEQITVPALPQSATVTSYAAANISLSNDMIFLGCRNGKIVIRSTESFQKHIFSTICHGDGNEAVTNMYWCVNRERLLDQQILGWLFTVGRDGKCSIHCINEAPYSSRKVHELVLPFGPNIESIYVNPSTFDVFIYGFHSKHFIVHNLSGSHNVMAVECGGAHRIWTFSPRFDQIGNIIGGKLAWTKASKLQFCEVKEQSHRISEVGGHGREIKTCAVASTVLRGSSVGPLIATGAEDTDIRLFHYSDAFKKISGLSVLRKHVTGVQALQWSRDGRYLFSCGGLEEFLIWRVEATPGVKVGVVCDSACPIENIKSELRITGFDVKEEAEDSETKDQDHTALVISMVYSNSMVKVS